MQTATAPQTEPVYSKPLVDRAFFGKDNCLSLQVRDNNCFFKWGRKSGDSWQWKTAKFSDVELGQLLHVLSGAQKEAKFYHSFGNESTQIWVSRVNDALILKADDFKKGLNPGEQKVLEVLLQHSIWMMNL